MPGTQYRNLAAVILVGASSWTTASAQPYTPYVIVQKNSIVKPDGSVEVVLTRLTGRRSDGVRVLIDWSGKNQETILRRIEYPEKGIWVSVDVPHKQKSTFGSGRRIHVSEGEPLCRYGPQEFDNIDKPDDIQGFGALHYRTQLGGNAVRDTWLTPELGCEEIRTITMLADGSVEKLLPVTIKKAEPDAEYFAVPDGLTEVDTATFLSTVNGRQLSPTAKAVQEKRYSEDEALRESKE